MKHLTLDQLTDHPKNVRAQAAHDESIDRLADNIAAYGLLQNLVVQELEDGAYGVLAGRRRLLALRALGGAGGLAAGFKVPVKLLPKTADYATAVSLAENYTQERMNPLDEFEAFAKMVEEGLTVETIAGNFGVTVRHVKERLRYGLVHPAIRAAARAGAITLDVMKAYAGHPAADVQKQVFDRFEKTPHDHQTWTVKRMLEDQDVRADSDVGAFILDDYRAKGGAMVVGLFDEDTVLTNAALVSEILTAKLAAVAEAERERLGLKWAESREVMDYNEFADWGRIYTKPKDLGEAETARLAEIAERLDAVHDEFQEIGDQVEPGSEGAARQAALSEEYDRLEQESDELQTAYAPEDAARAGVVASLDHSGAMRFAILVRPEDRPNAAGHGGADDGGPTGAATAQDDGTPLTKPLAQSLIDDLATERAELVAAAVAEDPTLAYDVMVFRAALDGFGGGYQPTGGLDVSFRTAMRGHSRREAVDPDAAQRIEAARAALDLSFLDDALSQGEQFRRFRALKPDTKAAILASAVSLAVMPLTKPSAGDREDFASALALEAVPETRALWTPSAANFWMRVSKPWILALLESFGMEGDADECRSMKKAALADFMERLFAEPFATLTPDQRAAVEAWAPEIMVPSTAGVDAIDDVAEDDGELHEDEEADPETVAA